MKIANPGLTKGYSPITKLDTLDWDDPKNTKMNFGTLILEKGTTYTLQDPLEKSVLLLLGSVTISWWSNEIAKENLEATRKSYFDEDPWAILVPQSFTVEITAISDTAELILLQTKNDIEYTPMVFRPEDCQSEARGKGTMRETSTRIVRTIYDKKNAPESNLVLGEVVNYPGKWSSYPPHSHPQPEIYHYRFLPEKGFGFGMMGYDDVACVHQGDTTLILNDVVHSQTSAPGYAMYYIWAIRHLENDPYGVVKFDPDHAWVMDETKDSEIWPIPPK